MSRIAEDAAGGEIQAPATPRAGLSAFVVSYNRAELLQTCLKALAFADEIIVIDKSSTDASPRIAAALADRVISVPWSPTVEETRIFALAQCAHEWVLCLDDDECLSPEAVLFIDAELRAPRADAYAIPLRHYILGRHDERAYYWPEAHYRLFRRDAVALSATVHAGITVQSPNVHEIPAETGACIHHLSHRDVAQWIEKTNRYTSRSDRALSEAGDDDLIGFAHRRIDFWKERTRDSAGADYPAAAALLRATYDIVDRLKTWEETAGPGGALLFPRIAARLERAYERRLGHFARSHRGAGGIERPALPASKNSGEELRLSRSVETLAAALRTERAERDATEAALRTERGEREAAEIAWNARWTAQQVLAADAQAEAARLQAELAALQASTAWRLTAPLRGIGQRLPWLTRLSRRVLARTPARLAPPDAAAASAPADPALFAPEDEPKLPEPLHDEEAQSAAETVPVILPAPELIQHVEPEEINLPQSSAPAVSVIIPTFGQVGFTLRCLASIARHLPATPLEILVIDDASADPDVERLTRVRGIRLIRTHINLGFLRTCNTAAQQACGEFLLFLNNDTQVLDEWLDPLVALLRARPDAGAVGSKLLFADGRLQEAGGITWSNGHSCTYGRGDDPDHPTYGYVREVDYVSGCSLLVRAELFARLGGFDELFAPAYCEDVDLAFRIREAGYKVLYQPRSRVVHFEGISNGLDPSAGVRRFSDINCRKLRARWADLLDRSHTPPETRSYRAAERGRPIVLAIGQAVADPRCRTALLVDILASDAAVKFWPLNGVHDPALAASLREAGIDVLEGDVPAFRGWLAAHGAEIDRAMLLDPASAEAWIVDLRLSTRASLDYIPSEAPMAASSRERAIWRGVETVLVASPAEAEIVELLEPGAEPRVLEPTAVRPMAERSAA